MRSELVLKLLKTRRADTLIAEINNVVSIVAEDARGLIFLENDFVLVGKYLKGVLFVYIHCLADAYGKHDSAKLIYFSYNTG
jgi:hypothetical protein